jgi:hypothetical protein
MSRYVVRPLVITALTSLVLLARPASASADITAFYGFSPTVDTRSAKGVAVGMASLLFGAEFEYSQVAESTADLAPGLKTYMGQGMLITPGRKAQLYLTAGVGRYNETFGGAEVSGTATSFGAGIKWRLAGPFKIRADYRTFSLQGSPVSNKPKRIYVGLAIGR